MAEVDEMKIGCGIKASSAEFVEIAGFDEVQTEILQPSSLCSALMMEVHCTACGRRESRDGTLKAVSVVAHW